MCLHEFSLNIYVPKIIWKFRRRKKTTYRLTLTWYSSQATRGIKKHIIIIIIIIILICVDFFNE